jgi:hypothetical protein
MLHAASPPGMQPLGNPCANAPRPRPLGRRGQLGTGARISRQEGPGRPPQPGRAGAWA